MAIVFMHDKQGAFICADTDRGVTCYSYPTSANAQQAHKAPEKVAALALANQSRHGFTHEIEYDSRNWNRLDAVGLLSDAVRVKWIPTASMR